MIRKYSNPILSGFYPDPSICRVDKDFYLVTSTFAYFPGIPVFHSRDLLNWNQIGNAIDRPGQLNYDENQVSRGLFAPTIRYNNGIYYILCTLIQNGGNFIITSKDPKGPWSDPVWLKGADGIDPSIFFDDDGKAWYCGTHPAPEGEAYPGNYEIYIREIDLKKLAKGKNPLTGSNTGIWRGALKDCIWPEGPHIYKKDGWYYLLHAEGGTGIDHAICVARAKKITGPYEGKKSNPILTHRYLGKNADIINVGHADFTDDTKGNWWMVLLASRPFDSVCPLGRETFMVPIYWENDWPFVVSKTGLIENEYPLPDLKTPNERMEKFNELSTNDVWCQEKTCDHFFGELPLNWLVLRMPQTAKQAAFNLTDKPGALRLFTKPETMRGKGHPAFAGRRIRHKNWAFSACLEFSTVKNYENAGIILFQNEDWHYRFEIYATASGYHSLRLIRAAGKEDELIGAGSCLEPGELVVLAVKCIDMELAFFFGNDLNSLRPFSCSAKAHILSTEYAGGFTGSLAGVFATANGENSKNFADVFWAEYKELI
ncbi:MAG: glycoside hydrolase family 43 protein [Treponema sp.]|nr:glycoside hydrolase family 43 protein [Treponema sp.]